MQQNKNGLKFCQICLFFLFVVEYNCFGYKYRFRQNNFFLFYWSWSFKHGLTSNKPTHYFLDYGNFTLVNH